MGPIPSPSLVLFCSAEGGAPTHATELLREISLALDLDPSGVCASEGCLDGSFLRLNPHSS